MHSSHSSTDESGSSSATYYPGSGVSSIDLSSACSVPSSDDTSLRSACPSPIVSSLSTINPDDGYCSPHVSSQPSLSHVRISTPVSSVQTSPVCASTPVSRITTVQPFVGVSTPVQSAPAGLQMSTPVLSAPTVQSSVGMSTPVSSSSIQQTSPLSSRTAVENPLVRAGLVPQYLADILKTAQTDEASKQSSRRITGVSVLTSNEYVEIMREKEKKEKEAAELKKKWKEKRELKKIVREKELERKKKEREEKKKQNENKWGKGRKRRCPDPAGPHKQPRVEDEVEEEKESGNESASDEEDNHDQPCSLSRASRSIRPPRRYRDESSDESNASTTVCIICDAREPPIQETMVFWVDCDKCGEWAHTHCAFGSNTATRNFMCSVCSM